MKNGIRQAQIFVGEKGDNRVVRVQHPGKLALRR